MPRRRKLAQDDDASSHLTPGCEVWAYLRVSSAQQAEKGLPIEGQRLAIERYCLDNDYRLARTYTDEAISGDTDERPEFLEMVADAKRRRPAGIIMWKWDRFSRDQNDAPYYRGDLRRHDIEIVTLADNIPQNVGEMRPVLEAMVDLYNQRYLKELSRNVRRGQHTLARLGYLPAPSRSVPLGYRAVALEIEINGKPHTVYRMELDPATAPRVRTAYDLRLAGATYWQIGEATHLMAQIPSYGLLFRNPTYKGEYMWRDTMIPTPAIVTSREWQQVYDGLARGRGGAYPRRKGSTFLLSGIAICGYCGCPLAAHSVGYPGREKRYRYYQCSGRANYRNCDFVPVRAPVLEAAVTGFLLDRILTAETVAQGQEALQAELERNRDDRAAGQRSLEAERTELQQTIERLVSAIEQAPESAPLVARLRERTAELRRVAGQLAALGQEVERTDVGEVDLAALREEMRATLEAGPVPLAREVLKRYILQVIVYDEEARVRYRPPFVLR